MYEETELKAPYAEMAENNHLPSERTLDNTHMSYIFCLISKEKTF